MHLWQTNPFQEITLVRGEGCTVWDTTGKSYLDLLSGTWCNVLGYGHPRWVAAARDQAARLTHTGASFLAQEVYEALSKLKEILPPQLDRVVFLNTGSEAVELALKMARAAAGINETTMEGVTKIAVVEQGYYGATTYALSLSEAGRGAQYLPSQKKILRLSIPHCKCCPRGYTWPCDEKFACLDQLNGLAGGGKQHVAAVIYEPVLGRGVFVPPIGYGARLRELTIRCKALLIANEVTTGLGRTGRWFGFEHDEIVPDILVIGKAIGAGLPVAAVVTTADIEQRCGGRLRHVQSHQNDPFSARIASTVISVLQREHLVERAAQRGSYLWASLKQLQLSGPWISDVRGRGAMVGVELDKSWSGKGTEITQRLLEEGFIVDYQPQVSTFRLYPPYIISCEEIDSFLKAFGRVLTRLDGHR